jgi:hypothetical protein
MPSSRAELATLGFAICLTTSASVALADCFLRFLLPIRHDFTNRGSSKVNLTQVNFLVGQSVEILFINRTPIRALLAGITLQTLGSGRGISSYQQKLSIPSRLDTPMA